MSSFHIQDVPQELHQRIQELANQANRSVDSEVVDLLKQAVRDVDFRRKQKEVLAGLRQSRFSPGVQSPNSLDLLREDRNR
ncbi:MAG: hypothetical protein KC931_23735 [Candidatus Omnitrophica bacterium]|nr:hypothetical protein [Candidatus Omnitrophota bacterium]